MDIVDYIIDSKYEDFSSEVINEAIWGENDTPSYKEIKDKFFNLNKEIYSKNILEEIESNVFNLEKVKDISELSKLI